MLWKGLEPVYQEFVVVCGSARIVPRPTAGAVPGGASRIAIAVPYRWWAIDNKEVGRLRPAVLVVPERRDTRLIKLGGCE